VQNKIDKFKQTYPEKDKSDAASVQEVIYSVFNYMGETYNESMPLNAFVTMKQMAEKKIKSTPKTTEDGQYE
jgi:hypothetical protein